MKTRNLWFYMFAVFLIAESLWAQEVNVLKPAFDPLDEIRRSFPDSICIEVDGEKWIEFCPDNTCDGFMAGKNVQFELLKDFAYLYVYFFSDYFVLDEWRNRKEPFLVAKNVLAKGPYQAFKREDLEGAARCLLRELAQKNQIQLYFVRYDEKIRSLVHRDIFGATAVTRTKKQKQRRK